MILCVTKLAGGLLFFLPFPLPCGGHYITLHYSTLPWGGHFITLHYSTLLGTLFLTLLYMCALWWQVVISLSDPPFCIQAQWLCSAYYMLSCFWGQFSFPFLSL